MGREVGSDGVEKRSVPPPGYTQIPNVLLDEVMLVATGAEWKVTCAIARQTFGWNRTERLLSNAQLCELTGLSRQAVTEGLKSAVERGYIGKRHVGGNKFVYGIYVRKPDSSHLREVPRNQAESFLESRKPPIQEKENPTGSKEREGAASGGTVKKPGKRKNGDLFKADTEDEIHAIIAEVFNAWAIGTGVGETAQLTVGRADKIRARLKEASRACPSGVEPIPFARAQILEAVKGMATSSWHRKNQQLDFTLLFRNRERIEFFLGRLAETGKEPGGTERFAAYDAQVENG